MKKHTCLLGLVVMMLSLSLHSAIADDTASTNRGTKRDAIAMVQKAVAYYKANGPDKSFAAFSDPHGQFVDRDIYLCVNDLNGVYLADGANKKFIGMNLLDSTDVNGKFFVKERVETAKTHDNFWMQYTFADPISHKLAPKYSYCERADAIVICAGVYTP